MELRECPQQETVYLLRVETDRDQRWRLAELGFVPGCPLRVLGRGIGGGTLIALGDGRIALDAETSRRVRVSTTPFVRAPMSTTARAGTSRSRMSLVHTAVSA